MIGFFHAFLTFSTVWHCQCSDCETILFWFSRKETFFKAVGLILFAYYVNMNNILAAMAELADARDLKSLDRKVVRVQSPLWAPKQNERVTIQIHTRLPFKISPFTLVVAIANANRRGFFFFPPSAPQPLRTRRHVFLHTLWAGSAYFPWEVGGASRASGGHPGSLSISAG